MAFEIQINPHAFAGQKTLYMDEQVVRFGDKEVMCRSISGFGYLTTQTSVNGIKTSKQFQIHLYQNDAPKPVNISFTAAFGGGGANDKFEQIIDKLWEYFGNRLLNDFHDTMLAGKMIVMNEGVKFNSQGVITRRKPLFKAAYEILTPWFDIRLEGFNGNVIIKSATNKKVYRVLPSLANNTWVAYNYVSWLQRNPAAVQALEAVPQSYKIVEKPA